MDSVKIQKIEITHKYTHINTHYHTYLGAAIYGKLGQTISFVVGPSIEILFPVAKGIYVKYIISLEGKIVNY